MASPYLDAALSEELFLEFAATTIQRHFRGYLVRKAFYASVRNQKNFEAARAALQYATDRQEWAACVIQSAWQGFRNKRIYQYYRDLVQFRERGDPKEMLRAINPREAQLADAASGIHVRFRLGGTMFPPLVFYKIFTHRSIADINAFGPRNYASESAPTAKDVNNKAAPGTTASVAAPVKHTKPRKTFEDDFIMDDQLREYIRPDGTLGMRSVRGWYARTDNNGWRPIAERILLDEDPITTITRLKRTPLFHYNPAVRRAERVKRAKQRQREWLVRLYRSEAVQEALGTGKLEPGCKLEEALAVGAGEDLEGPDSQADELLDWCHHLNFSDYASEWTSMACTLASEAFVPGPEPAALLTRALPPPHQDVQAAMVAAGVPLQPYQGSA